MNLVYALVGKLIKHFHLLMSQLLNYPLYYNDIDHVYHIDNKVDTDH